MPIGLVTESPRISLAAQGFSGQQPAGIRCLVKGEPGQAAICLGGCRLRHASALRAFNAALGVNVTHIPYRGAGPAMQDVIVGASTICATRFRPARPRPSAAPSKGSP